MSDRSKYYVDQHTMVTYPEGPREGVYGYALISLDQLPNVSEFEDVFGDSTVVVQDGDWQDLVWATPELRHDNKEVICLVDGQIARVVNLMLSSVQVPANEVELEYAVVYTAYWTPTALQVSVVECGYENGKPVPNLHELDTHYVGAITHGVAAGGVKYSIRHTDVRVCRGYNNTSPRRQKAVISILAPILLAIDSRTSLYKTNGLVLDNVSKLESYFRPIHSASELLKADMKTFIAACREAVEGVKERLVLSGVKRIDITSSVSVHYGSGVNANVPEVEIFIYVDRQNERRVVEEKSDNRGVRATELVVREKDGIHSTLSRVPHATWSDDTSGILCVMSFNALQGGRPAVRSSDKPIYGKDGMIAYNNLNELLKDWYDLYAVSSEDKEVSKKYVDTIKDQIYAEMSYELKRLPAGNDDVEIWADVSVCYSTSGHPRDVIVVLRGLDSMRGCDIPSTNISTCVCREDTDAAPVQAKRTAADLARKSTETFGPYDRTTITYDMTSLNNRPVAADNTDAETRTVCGPASDFYRSGHIPKPMQVEGTNAAVVSDLELYLAVVASASEVYHSAISYVTGRLVDRTSTVTFTPDRRPATISVSMLAEKASATKEL